MGTVTINDKTEELVLSADDFIPVWSAASGAQRKAKRAAIVGATITGGGTINTGGNALNVTSTSAIGGNLTGGGTIATAGFTGTMGKTGTIPVGTGTAGRVAAWVTDANTLQASTLAKTGAGVLTLSAASAYTVTVPATGTAALLGTAQTFTAAQTIDNSSGVGLAVTGAVGANVANFNTTGGANALTVRENGNVTMPGVFVASGSNTSRTSGQAIATLTLGSFQEILLLVEYTERNTSSYLIADQIASVSYILLGTDATLTNGSIAQQVLMQNRRIGFAFSGMVASLYVQTTGGSNAATSTHNSIRVTQITRTPVNITIYP
jgi:hypothetical protein